MRLTFLTLGAMAVSAFAAPAPAADGSLDVLQTVPKVLESVTGGLAAPKAPKNAVAEAPAALVTRQTPDALAGTSALGIDGLVELLEGLVESLLGSFANIGM